MLLLKDIFLSKKYKVLHKHGASFEK